MQIATDKVNVDLAPVSLDLRTLIEDAEAQLVIDLSRQLTGSESERTRLLPTLEVAIPARGIKVTPTGLEDRR
jgi:hypothetical protein